MGKRFRKMIKVINEKQTHILELCMFLEADVLDECSSNHKSAIKGRYPDIVRARKYEIEDIKHCDLHVRQIYRS